MQREDLALACPRCRVHGGQTHLVAGAPLDGRFCPRCGGILLPASGSERLLHEELALDRARLVELADGFGGRRSPCASCGARVRPLLLRGVDLDVCFHCGALWFDRGELTRLSGGRHVEPALSVSLDARPPTATALRPIATVRLDARSPERKLLGGVVRGTGVAMAVASAVGLATSSHALLMGALLVVGGTALRKRAVVDVFPRAGRLLRSRAWMPTDARDPRAERFDDGAVVVRRWGPLTQALLVDDIGRTLVVLERGRAGPVRRAAAKVARRLGVGVIDHARSVDARALPAFGAGPSDFVVRSEAQPGNVRFVAEFGGRRQFSLTNAIPARGDEEGAARRALCFFLEDDQGRRLRLHDDDRGHTVVVDDASDAVAVVERSERAWGATGCGLVGRAPRVWMTPQVASMRTLHDDDGRRLGTVRRDFDRVQIEFADGVDAGRWLCVVALVADALVADRLG